MNRLRFFLAAIIVAIASFGNGFTLPAEEIPRTAAGFKSHVAPFLETYCIHCHDSETSKGQITLHALNGDLSAGREPERWDLILRILERGEMPPEGELQPEAAERKGVAEWIAAGLREYVQQSHQPSLVPATRRLTNFEYQNTVRDLLGFELKLIDQLPQDPVKPYHFNNTAEMMRIGPEQLDRYLQCARRAMASAIVDPAMPVVHQTRMEWKPWGLERGMGGDEVGVWGNRRGTPAGGMGLKSFPKTGEFRVRMQASAILPAGVNELPLRLVMGYGLGENLATLLVEPIADIRLSNNPDEPQVFEFRGRIENFPPRPGLIVKETRQPDSMVITLQNLYDDGTLNDGERNLALPRAVVNWLEFEAPITDVWPPLHHTRILFESPLRESDPPAYIQEVLKRFLARAYRRPATNEEVARFVAVYELVLPELGSLEAAMRETLAMVMISPQFLYHTVAKDDVVLQQYELSAKLSYFLWGSMPDDELLRLAEEGKLAEPSVIEAQVRRLLADQRSYQFVDNFTEQWLSLAKMKTVPINRELFPRFLYYVPLGERAGTEVPYRPTIRDYMHQETVGFMAELIRRNASVLNVVDSDFAYINQPLAAHYGVDGVEGIHLRPVPIKPEHHLGGLLTHGSVLVGNGTGSAPHPIYRAVWLREAILGDEVKPPPADVPALTDTAGESAEKALSIKDLLAAHRQKTSCNECHVRLDPWGIPFEHYNAIGKFQPFVPKEGTRVNAFNKLAHANLAGYAAYLQSINTVEIHADSRVPRGPEIDGIEELKSYLLNLRREEIAENMIRRLLTYSIGRELTYRDRFAVEDLIKQTKQNEFKLQDMIVAICQSETFTGIKPQHSKK